MPRSRVLSRQRDKLKPLYFHRHSACVNQTWQESDLPEGTPSNKLAWFLSHVVLQDHVANSKRFISATTMLRVAKVVPPIKLHDLSII